MTSPAMGMVERPARGRMRTATRRSSCRRTCDSGIDGETHMALSLYDTTIPCFRQTLGAVAGLLVTAESFCADKGVEPKDIIEARLAEDMLPFAYQVKSTAVLSLGAIEGVRR